MKAVVLNNEMGHQLVPLTHNCSRPMLPVLNRPLMEFLFYFFIENAVDEIFLITNSAPHELTEQLAKGKEYGLQIHCIQETHTAGTAGCLRVVEESLQGEPLFALFDGINFLRFDLSEAIRFHLQQHATVTATAIRKSGISWPLEGIRIANENHIESFYRNHHSREKRIRLTPCGLYLINPHVFSFLGKDGYLDFKEQLIPRLKSSGLKVLLREVEGYYSSVHTISDYFRIQRDILNGQLHADHLNNQLLKISDSVWSGHHTHISNRAKIVGPMIIGDHCLIEEDSLLIGPAVIGNRCQIKKRALLRESILWDRSVVEEDSRVENCILETESSISQNTILKNTVVSANGLGPYLPLPFESIPFRVQSKKKIPFFTKHSTTMYELVKPCVDTFLSLIILGLTLPLSLVIALAIKLDSRGNIFFTKKRCGKDGKEFKMVKFRSMIQDAETIQERLRDQNEMDGPMFKIPQDPRLTRVGRLLRKFSLDELPQFLNVLLGDMSIVGPRPLSAEEMKFNPAWRDIRLTVKPGITGLWQINCRSEGSFKDWIRNDISYVKKRSLWLDLKIVLRTIVVVVKSLGAY